MFITRTAPARALVTALLAACLALAAGAIATPAQQAQAASSDFVFPRSSYELLTYNDLYGLSSHDLYVARNEIFARHGYIFVNDDLRARFSGMPWYTPLYTEEQFSWDLLNEVEQSNIALIQQREAELAGQAAPYDYVFPTSSYQLLSQADLQRCTAYQLYLARNEIFARHGYIFENADLQTYFGSKSWYQPRYTAAEFVWEWLSSIEMKNIALIQQREELLASAAPNVSVSVTTTSRVVTDYFTFDLPQYWLGYVDVTSGVGANGYPVVNVTYKGCPDMVLVSFDVVNSSDPLNGGDIGGGLIGYWDNGRGQRIEMWCRNFIYATQCEYLYGQGSSGSPYPNEFVEAALVDLSTGGAWTVEGVRSMATAGEYGIVNDGYTFYDGVIAPTVMVL